jgi:formylglycine-generating enzyme required for sulfatase activity
VGALTRTQVASVAVALVVAAGLARMCVGGPDRARARAEPHDADRGATRGDDAPAATFAGAADVEAEPPPDTEVARSRGPVPSPSERAEDSSRPSTSSKAADVEFPRADDHPRGGVAGAVHAAHGVIAPSSSHKFDPGEFVPSEVQPLAFQRTEVTHDALAVCMEVGACPPRTTDGEACARLAPARGDEPARCVTQAGARAYCRWLGGRLPTAAEWVAEATDGDQRRFPWGSEVPSCERAIVRQGCGRGGPWRVCSRPLGHSRTGLCDLVGNVLEWTAEVRDGHAHVMGVDLSVNLGRPLRVSAHEPQPDVGFRCVRELSPE